MNYSLPESSCPYCIPDDEGVIVADYMTINNKDLHEAEMEAFFCCPNCQASWGEPVTDVLVIFCSEREEGSGE